MPVARTDPSRTVDSYLAGLPEDARQALAKVRDAIREAAPLAEERISYGIPLYRLNGKHPIGFGASKHHLSLYVTDSSVLETYANELAEFDHGGTKTTIRFTPDKPLPKSLVAKIVRTRIRELEGRELD